MGVQKQNIVMVLTENNADLFEKNVKNMNTNLAYYYRYIDKNIIKVKFYWNLLKTKQKDWHGPETKKILFDTKQEKDY